MRPRRPRGDGWRGDRTGEGDRAGRASGLTQRMLAASALLTVTIAAAFAGLLFAIDDVRDAERRVKHSEEVLVAANALERLVLDLETGQRGYLLTGEERFLEPWRKARRGFPVRARRLLQLVASDRKERALVLGIERAERSYVRDYSVPLLAAARRGEPSARSVAATEEGRVRVDAMRNDFDRVIAAERRAVGSAQARVSDVAQRAAAAAVIALVGSVVLIALYAGYLTRAIVRPVRRAAGMAVRLAGGDLRARMPETGVAEIGELERAFNVMGDSLERAQEELRASRARVIATADETRRRIERDLHDGTQQRLVSATLQLRAAEATVPPEMNALALELRGVAAGLDGALEELREFARGIHPAILAEGGLAPALRALARRSAVPVRLILPADSRLPERIEVAAYFVVSEALANAAKHAQASRVTVEVQRAGGVVRVRVEDDGVGGADLGHGSGIVGLKDRVEALGGGLTLRSEPGAGTTITVELPLAGTDPGPTGASP